MENDLQLLFGFIEEEIKKTEDPLIRNKVSYVFATAMQKLNAVKIEQLSNFNSLVKKSFGELKKSFEE